ncbi:MAG: hypothetical protein ACJ74J_06930 [Blastocatellia bacterium]
MNIKRIMLIAGLAVAIAALALPLASFKARAAGSSAEPRATVTGTTANAGMAAGTVVAAQPEAVEPVASQEAAGHISPSTLETLGIQRVPKGKLAAASAKAAQHILASPNGKAIPLPADHTLRVSTPQALQPGPPLFGEPAVLNVNDALSAALITTIGGRDTQFSEVALLADWDGREDCVADRGAKIDDFSGVESDIDFTLTRAAISEHTRGNGHPFFNVYYYGDSVGNVWIGVDFTGSPLVDVLFQINLPSLVNTGANGGFTLGNPTAGDCMDDQATVTGIAVNPVADLGDFSPALCGTTGEVVYISVHDSEGCASNAAGNPIRTRIFAFGLTEGSDAGGGFITFTPNLRQILRSKFSNIAGVSVDDDGSLYYQLVDLIQFTGGALFKATELTRTVANCSILGDAPGGGLAGPRINRFIPSIPDPPTLNSWQGTAANPVVISGGSRHTNYGGGSSTLYGDIVAITNAPSGNALYAAVSRSFVATDDPFTQLTEGLFPAPAAFTAGTPSMVISFADCSGAFDICSGNATGGFTTNVGGAIPAANGIADAAVTGQTVTPGVNNYRVFVLGNGPDIRQPAGGTSIVPNTLASVLKVDMQIDYQSHSGLAVNEEGTVFVVSGGAPGGPGKNPSPMLGEILCFEDMCPMDRRADFVDLRGDAFPNPPLSGGNVGDGDSDRFDHIFWQAPIDQVTLTPTGISGLARGFLRYTNRLVGTNPAAVPLGPGVTLGTTQPVLGDDDSAGTIIFENLDPGHQVAGGDDQHSPFRGDDDDGAGTPALAGALNGGFEFLFGGPVGTAGCVWNGFFWNSNGNITFGAGDTDNTPTVPEFRIGLPKIAPAWADFNPSARATTLSAFPVQALGFANINAFKVRWINVPEFGSEGCTGTSVSPGNASNTFAVTLYDDGTGIDENASQPLSPANPIGNNAVPFDLQEGPTDLRFTREPNTGVLVGCPPRPEGSGIFLFEYGRMDLLGTPDRPVITGYSIGGLNPLNPPGLCETNLSEAARAAETTFGVLVGNQTAAIGCNCLIGEGTEPTIYELFNAGADAGIGSGGEITFATPDFDLRFEGNDAAACTSTRQRDANRAKVGFRGVGCAPPANALCTTVVPSPFVTTPTTSATGLVNALCAVQLNLVGCGFFPNEATVICQGFQSETGVPLQRPGKTVSTAATLACDTNGDGVIDTTVALTAVTPVSCNLVRATIPTSASFGATTTSGFPAACCGGPAVVTVTTTFTAGDNNIFGAFTRTSVCALNLGVRAPVVISVTPSSGNCAVAQDVLITGACFTFTTPGPNGTTITGGVTSVFALERGNPANRINANPFVVVNPNLIDAFFNFGSASAGKTFLIFVQGTGGTSRNRTAAQAGEPAGCALGNEQGVQVTFTCNTNVPGPGTTPPGTEQAVVNGCTLERQETGQFVLLVIGSNIKSGATATVGGVTPKKIKFVELEQGSTTSYKSIRLVKKVCGGLPGNVVVTNPGSGVLPSTAFFCNTSCPSN